MLHNDETQKHTLIEEAAGLAASHAAALSEDARAIGDFIRAFYQHVPPTDIVSRAPSDLSEAALSLWRFAAEREPGRPKVRVLPPSEAKGLGPARPASCRSSTTTCRSSSTGQRRAEPAATSRPSRDPSRPAREAATKAAGSSGRGRHRRTTSGIVMHVEVDQRAPTASRMDAVAGRSRGGAGRCARRGRPTGDDARQAARRSSPRVAAAGRRSRCRRGRGSGDFLAWLDDDNFTFLGYPRIQSLGEGDRSGRPWLGMGSSATTATGSSTACVSSTRLPPDVQDFLRQPQLLIITKSNRRRTVHRPRRDGRASASSASTTAARWSASSGCSSGLFTSLAYSRSPRAIPLLRLKVRAAASPASGFAAGQPRRQGAAAHPRHLPARRAVPDQRGRSCSRPRSASSTCRSASASRCSCAAIRSSALSPASSMCRATATTRDLRRRFAAILEQAFAGRLSHFYTHLDESVLARVQFIVAHHAAARCPTVDVAALEQQLVEAGRGWSDRLREALAERWARQGAGPAAPPSSRFRSPITSASRPAQAIADLAADRGGARPARRWSSRSHPAADDGELAAQALSRAASRSRSPTCCRCSRISGCASSPRSPSASTPRERRRPVWIHEFDLAGPEADCGRSRRGCAGASRRRCARSGPGTSENDGFNRLVLAAGLSAREVIVLRALLQVSAPGRQQLQPGLYGGHAGAHPDIAARLGAAVRDAASIPAGAGRRDAAPTAMAESRQIEHALDGVDSLDEDRILRSFLT